MMKYLQNLGRSLMLPVAVLPAAALLMGIGNWILNLVNENSVIGNYLTSGGGAILDNLGILFAVGVAIGMSKEQDGAAGLSGLVAWLVAITVLSVSGVAGLQGIEEGAVNPAFENTENVFIGILSGIVASLMYNRFSQVRLPDALAFFSGKRLVPIMSAAAMMVVSAALFFIWPLVYSALVSFGEAIINLEAIGAGLYGFFNRLLIPTGLHHALNSVFWFDVAGINDIANFWASEGEQGITGRYQAGFYPIMMFGLPAAALAMYHTAKTKRKKQAASLLMAAAFASFFTGVTEALEFSFMFLAPVLYVVHAALTGLSLFIAAMFEWTAGFSFSAGLVDYTLSLGVPIANQPYMLIVQGLVFGVIYYFVFRFLIVKLDLKTPGREEGESGKGEVDESYNIEEGTLASEKDETAIMAAKIYEGLGGDANVLTVDNCVSRLRLEVDDMDKVDQDKIKETGVPGINVVGKHNIQVVVGTQVQFVADEIRKIRKRD
ncbi:N-acetylglucosamine-specific PTS transporter subunit IIBC [Virgibacillus sp. NKC19-3]|uniref:N-acetylglucosamine-specific PTS transporter subunit IIBC n=1 Tax=Virgibacillus saliphilus TaxID=2831674 RepID=UPI001C9B4724|nr:N-acetylglucosamine-specific PTS transporter subunit IIBC [Virgibacillus sp. NKC19-3]MBY7144408.1 N-acetylglucosamine-specific PTS transporter subunit IIBC [Virgibacillus sp. NKC19-3]